MIFVTLGSQKFQFNRLLKSVDDLIKKKIINEDVVAQIGSSDYKPVHFKYTDFMDRDKFSEYLESSDIILTHAGTGVIVNALKKGKKVIAVPRLKKYREHVDDHQKQIIQQFKEASLICGLDDCRELEEAFLKIRSMNFKKYVSNTQKYIEDIDNFIKGDF